MKFTRSGCSRNAFKKLGFDTVSIRQTVRFNVPDFVRTLVAASLAWLAANSLSLAQIHWAVISAIVVAQATPGATARAGRDRILATAFGVMIGASSGVLFVHGWPMPTVVLVALIPSIALAGLDRNYRTAPVAALIVLSSIGTHASPLAAALLRLAEITVGALVGVVVSRYLFHTSAQAQIRRHAVELIDLLISLTKKMAAAQASTPETQEKFADAIRATLQGITLAARGMRHSHGEEGVRLQRLATLLRRLYDDIIFLARIGAIVHRKATEVIPTLKNLSQSLQLELEKTRQQLMTLQCVGVSMENINWEITIEIETLSSSHAATPLDEELRAVLRFNFDSIRHNLEQISQLTKAMGASVHN